MRFALIALLVACGPRTLPCPVAPEAPEPELPAPAGFTVQRCPAASTRSLVAERAGTRAATEDEIAAFNRRHARELLADGVTGVGIGGCCERGPPRACLVVFARPADQDRPGRTAPAALRGVGSGVRADQLQPRLRGTRLTPAPLARRRSGPRPAQRLRRRWRLRPERLRQPVHVVPPGRHGRDVRGQHAARVGVVRLRARPLRMVPMIHGYLRVFARCDAGATP